MSLLAHYVAADDRALRGGPARAVLEHGRYVPGRLAACRCPLEGRAALEAVPAVIVAGSLSGGCEVDLLSRVLADVADRDVAGRPVEREAPRVPQSVRVDLGKRAGLPDERVVGRHLVRDARLACCPRRQPKS